MGRRKARRLEQLPVGGSGRFAVAWTRLFPWRVLRSRRGRRNGLGAALQDAQRPTSGPLDRAYAEWDPFRRVLEPVRLGVAAGVGVLEAFRLDPHPLALEKPQHAGL